MKHNIIFLILCLSITPNPAFAAKTLKVKKENLKIEEPPKEEPESFVKRFLPNNVSYEFARDTVDIRLEDRPTLHIKTKVLSNNLGEASRLAAKISFSKVPKNKEGFQFQWSPLVSLAFYNFEVESDSVFFKDTTFQFFRVIGGFGPEVKYTENWGTVSFLIAPAVNYSWVSWSSPVSGGSFAKSNFTAGAALNYQKPLSDRWYLQIFYKVLLEDETVWKEALTSSQGLEVPVKSVMDTVVGIAFGYRWD
jgi:hypothetical protein